MRVTTPSGMSRDSCGALFCQNYFESVWLIGRFALISSSSEHRIGRQSTDGRSDSSLKAAIGGGSL